MQDAGRTVVWWAVRGTDPAAGTRTSEPSLIVDPKRAIVRAAPRPPRCALCIMAQGASHTIADSQQDRLLQKFQRFQFVQSTRARFTCQRLEQCFRYRFNTMKIVQAGHGSEGEFYRVALREYGGRE